MPAEKQEKIAFNFEDHKKNTIVQTDATRLAQILTNLISNAIKYTNEGYINFGYKENAENILFYVKDSGIGIKEDNIQNIFDRFTKLDDSSNITYRGAGIGLSIAKKIVELLNGKIWVESKIGKGSNFYFTLPLKSEPRPLISDVESKVKLQI